MQILSQASGRPFPDQTENRLNFGDLLSEIQIQPSPISCKAQRKCSPLFRLLKGIFCQKRKTAADNCNPQRFGAPRGTRTPDLLVRSQSLYPAELLAHSSFFLERSVIIAYPSIVCQQFFKRKSRTHFPITACPFFQPFTRNRFASSISFRLFSWVT